MTKLEKIDSAGSDFTLLLFCCAVAVLIIMYIGV